MSTQANKNDSELTVKDSLIVQIKNILTPVRLLSVEDFERIALAITNENFGDKPKEVSVVLIDLLQTTLKLQRRWEEMTRGKWVTMPFDKPNLKAYKEMGAVKQYANDCDLYVKNRDNPIFQPALLKKEHFVCEVEKPAITEWELSESQSMEQVSIAYEYEAAKKKVWFEGFEKFDNNSVTNGSIAIWFNKGAWIEGRSDSRLDTDLNTVYDLMYQLDKHGNKSLTPTDAFVEGIINGKIE